MKLDKITIGADPELFIYDKKERKFISSIGIIPGEKGKAFKIDGAAEGYGIQVDNVLAEFNIPPTNNLQNFCSSINFMKSCIKDLVSKVNPNYTIKCQASAIFDDDQLQSKEATLFGCDPDFSCYTRSRNEKPEGAATNLRSAGFHIHIGYPNNTIEDSIRLIKYMDAYVGLISLLHDTDVERRKLYGKAGCFRLTPYGCEYRTLSGFMLSSNKLVKLVYNRTIKAIEAFNQGKSLPSEFLVKNAIDLNNATLAEELIKEYNLN